MPEEVCRVTAQPVSLACLRAVNINPHVAVWWACFDGRQNHLRDVAGTGRLTKGCCRMIMTGCSAGDHARAHAVATSLGQGLTFSSEAVPEEHDLESGPCR